MPRKGENIYKRKDGRWEARYIKCHDASGKAIYGFCYGKTYTEAKNKVTAMKSQPRTSLIRETESGEENRRFSAFCDCWLELRKSSLKPSTHTKYDLILNNYIKPQLGDFLPSAISTELVEQFKSELLNGRKLAPKTVRDILMVLKMTLIFTRKQTSGEMRDIDITYPKEQKKEMRVLTREEQEKLVQFLFSEMDLSKFGIYLALTTGLRIGELCALRREDISLMNRTITVSSTVLRVKNFDTDSESKTRICIGNPKSDSSSRTIPLTDTTAALCQKFMPENSGAFVMTGTENHLEPRTLQYRFKHYMDECGLEGVHFHTLRHTFATRCVEVGFEIKSLSEILGHANTSITLNRYVHSSIEMKRNNMSRLSAAGF